MKSVYLAGPISGLTFDAAKAWRDVASRALWESGIAAISPLRFKTFLSKFGVLDADGRRYENESPLSSQRGITTRDRYDCTRADVVLVNFLGATTVSIGTVIELAWADSKRIPIVCVMEDGNPHDHMMVRELIDFRTSSLAEAIDLCKAILLE